MHIPTKTTFPTSLCPKQEQKHQLQWPQELISRVPFEALSEVDSGVHRLCVQADQAAGSAGSTKWESPRIATVGLGAYDLRHRESSRQTFSIRSIRENGCGPQENLNGLLLLQLEGEANFTSSVALVLLP
uniref:Azurocidin 1 n=1 Tax=Myotis myotis TaxID=51298 RepID=A0A7J7XEL6_MYOMY|nr:azurocidin 1 [Myotis myotis]